MTGKTKYTATQDVEIWGGRTLSFLGGLVGGSGILGVAVSAELSAAGTFFTDKGHGINLTTKEFFKIAAENAGMALGGAVLGVVGKYASGFLKSGVGVAARDSEKGIVDASRDSIPGPERRPILGAKGNRMNAVEATPSSDWNRVQKDWEATAKLKKIGVDIHPAKMEGIEVRSMAAQPYLDKRNADVIMGRFDCCEHRHVGGNDRILIASQHQKMQFDFQEQKKAFLHELAHAYQKLETPSDETCEYGHDDDFQLYHNVAVIRAYGTGHISEKELEIGYMGSGRTAGGEKLEIRRYLNDLKKDFEEQLGRPMKETDQNAFKSFLGSMDLHYQDFWYHEEQRILRLRAGLP